jgi:hypothetical protein
MANKIKFYIKEQQEEQQSNKYESLFIADGGKEPDWLKKASFENATVEITEGGYVMWKYGIWKNGVWEDGTWEDGIWEGGTWEYGVWGDGVWERGTWEKGRWEEGVWENGILLSCEMRNPDTDQYEQINDSRKMKYYYGEY